MPTKAEVAQRVTLIISDFANLKPARINPDFVLTDPPLKLDSVALAQLALALRGYIKAHNPAQTITVTETRKSGLTVQQLINLVHTIISRS